MNKNIILFSLILFLAFTSAIETDYGNKIEGDNYNVLRDKIERDVLIGDIFYDYIEVENTGTHTIDISMTVTGDASNIVNIENASLSIPAGESGMMSFFIKGEEGVFSGTLKIGGEVAVEIPIAINVTDGIAGSPFLMEVSAVKNNFDISKSILFNLNIKKLKNDDLDMVAFVYTLYGENNDSYKLGNEDKAIANSMSFVKEFISPENSNPGKYYLMVEAEYKDYKVTDKVQFSLYIAFFDRLIFGFLPMWLLISILGFFLLVGVTIYIIKKRIESRKKYKMMLDLKTIPKKDKDFLFLGKIAETNRNVYYDPNKFTTHSIVAGATGGGKSITAQVLVEECLMKDIAVVVFDPTAQWSGMLRKCTDKKMMAYYPKFGLKPKDARAFKGNVRMIKNARQVIDLEKHINPGQIQIFSLNKLDPSEMDIFVASIIRQIFKSDPKEFPNLKVLLVFDEVHRLLPKFGGNGEGFLQIERACREFRKWGLGVMLVSQVLNDFVGSIKANISTELQMRTRDEGDLGRIQTKYGEEFLQSLVKASVGVGMFSNPAYNHAQPFFINFRPILHNTRRLTDEELDEYNKFNDIVDELEFQVEKLEEEKIDVFDLKMELKLIKDKIMTGSFSVVDIYLEGLTPRVAKEWEKLGKPAPKLEIELVSEEEIQAAIAEAKKKHDKEQAIEDSAAEKETVKKEKVSLDEKIVKNVTFDNGVMISSLKEMKEYLPNMDESVFAIHVNDEKHDIASWVTENFGESEGKIISEIKDKEDILEALKKIGAEESKKESEAEEPKPENDKEKKSTQTSEDSTTSNSAEEPADAGEKSKEKSE